jgi:staphylococcal nuclease homologue|nr:MAG TPA: nuclease-like protein [Caudoviricetes sp.]
MPNYQKQPLHKEEFHSVGGDATHIIFNFPGYGYLHMGSLLSLSYQIFRDKVPVYNLGNTNIDGFAIGKRYVAGSIVKTSFLHDDLRQFLQDVASGIGVKEDVDSIYQLKLEKQKTYHHLMMDDVLPFDIIILMTSEYGGYSVSEVIYGATLINSGQVHSIHDIITENTFSFVARDARQTRNKLGSIVYGESKNLGVKASQLSENNINYHDPQRSYFYERWNQEVDAAARRGTWTPDEVNRINAYSQLAGNGTKANVPLEYIEAAKNEYKNGGITQMPDVNTGSRPNTYDSAHIDKNSFTSTNPGFEVEDGDTVHVKAKKTDGTEYKTDSKTGKTTLRFMGIDTPETEHGDNKGQEYGKEASDFLKKYVQDGKWDRDIRDGVTKIVGTDVYGRKLFYNPRYIEEAVESGSAWFRPESARQAGMSAEDINRIKQKYHKAKAERKGLWGGNKIVDPAAHRKTWDK